MNETQSVYEAMTEGRGVSRNIKRYSDQGLAALTDVVLESILSETEKTTVKVTEVRERLVEFFGATLRKASFNIIRDTINDHPWTTKTGENTFRLKRQFDERDETLYT